MSAEIDLEYDDRSYVHEQVNPSPVVLVQHNRGDKPAAVQAFFHEIGVVALADATQWHDPPVAHINDNAFTVTFDEPFRGTILAK